MGSVVILTDLDPRLDEMRPQRALRDLQFQPVERHAIAVAGEAFFLNAQNLAKIGARNGHESRAFLRGLHGDTRIVRRDIDSRRKILAASAVTIPASASSLVRRSCKVWKTRSGRPLACGE